MNIEKVKTVALDNTVLTEKRCLTVFFEKQHLQFDSIHLLTAICLEWSKKRFWEYNRKIQ